MVSSFQTWMEVHNIDFYFVEWARRLILKFHLDLFKNTSIDIVELLLKSFKSNSNKELREMIHMLVMYSISEYRIYSNYNIFVITASCCLIATNSNIKLKEYLQKITKEDEYIEIKNCVSDITSLYNSSNEDMDN